ncbi:hypothetical protein PDE_02651 [Penicillium oxalicum 114-2]|uniref:Uncharacterized protein n=1 Tax=Penicillium oxalicum (strain 114-2 / CGMCC 5302) TaxID=933388 RepID=S8B077_PENO1|nr:hypothetical protein PDE_02651 [Penicillium oxalicum 114-2]
MDSRDKRSKPFPVVFVHPSSCQNGSHPTESQGRLFLELPTARQPQYCMATNASEWGLKDLGAASWSLGLRLGVLEIACPAADVGAVPSALSPRNTHHAYCNVRATSIYTE